MKLDNFDIAAWQSNCKPAIEAAAIAWRSSDFAYYRGDDAEPQLQRKWNAIALRLLELARSSAFSSLQRAGFLLSEVQFLRESILDIVDALREEIERKGAVDSRYKNWGRVTLDARRQASETTSALDSILEEAGNFDLPIPSPQLIGLKFKIETGIVDFADVAPAAPSEEDKKRIEAFTPMMAELLSEAVEVFSKGNVQYDKILKTLRSYASELREDKVDYNKIAAYGIILEGAEWASERDIPDRFRPRMEDDCASVLNSLLNLHGIMLQSTEVGRAILADAERYHRTRDELKKQRQASVEVAKGASEYAVATPEVGKLLVSVAEEIGNGRHSDRSSVFGVGTVGNFVSMALGGAVAAAVGSGDFSDIVRWLSIVLFAEGVKKSKIGQGAAEAVRDTIDDPSQEKNMEKLREFVLKHEDQIRTLAGDRRERRWISKTLDWLIRRDDDLK